MYNKTTHSQCSQDIFVINVLQHKKNGYFLEIGSNHAINDNNTYLLEKDYNFKGLLVEYCQIFEEGYKTHRQNSIYEINDARNVNYKKILDDNNFPKNIDYLQIDLDADNKSTLDTLILLNNTVFDTYKFATITFEHDYYRGDFFDTRNISRNIFKSRGYLLVFPDVCTDQGCVGSGWQPFEDWYVHPDLVDMIFVNNIVKSNTNSNSDYIKNNIINEFNKYNKCKMNNDVYFLSHNGLGDNLFSIGALYFLLNYYENVYFLCKDKNYENNKLFFKDEPRIICVTFNSNDEYNECKKIIEKIYYNNDVLISGGCHKAYLNSKITNKKLLEYTKNDDLYEIADNFCFVKEFYNENNLDLSIAFNYWKLPHTQKSIDLYTTIKKYYIIFIHLTSSDNIKLNISSLMQRIYDENIIIIGADINVYENLNNNNEDIVLKKNICDNFINLQLVYYLDTIVNSNEIYIINSCFSGIVIPLEKQNRLKASTVKIIRREECDKIIV